jgi:hypothetical protein
MGIEALTAPLAAAVLPDAKDPAAATFAVLLSRFNRFKSPRISAAIWKRRSGSFSSALETISSSFGGRSGLICVSG